ncbi:protein PAT1 homolog 1-like [Corticium candelabrum]|uniref:protein PAT1 homolog 1-like n=1 Tax=Corticium candelabrum TaxID=121492 RepID=UPI002E25511D|nr:protein PAT1 homolog 1-like [Corticium candelabrum]
MSGYRSYRPPRGRHTRSTRQQHNSRNRNQNGGNDVDTRNDETFGPHANTSADDADWEETHRKFAEMDLKSRGVTKPYVDENSQDDGLDLERTLNKLVDDEDETSTWLNSDRTGDTRVHQIESPMRPHDVSGSVSSAGDMIAGLQAMGVMGFGQNVDLQQSLFQQGQSGGQGSSSLVLPPGLPGKVLTVEELEEKLTSTSEEKADAAGQWNDLARMFAPTTSQQMCLSVGQQSLPLPPVSQQKRLDADQSDDLAQILVPVTSQQISTSIGQQSFPLGLPPPVVGQQRPLDVGQQSSPIMMNQSLPPSQEGISSSLRFQLPAAHMSALGQQVPQIPFPLRGPLLLPQIPNPRMPFPGQMPPGLLPQMAQQFMQLTQDPRFSAGVLRTLPSHLPYVHTGVLPAFSVTRMPGMPLLQYRGPVPNLVQEPILVGQPGSQSPIMGGGRSHFRDLHPNELEYSTSTAEDPYAGLMTRKEKDYIIKIQMMQLQSQNPFTDDYYYQMITMKRKEEEMRQKAKERGTDSDDEERDKENTKIIIPNVTVETREYKPPVDSEGSLGKITVGSITSPRKTLDVCPVSSSQTTKLDAHPSVRRKLLITIENLYQLLLEIDELERRAQALPDDDASKLERNASENREKILALIGIDGLDESGCYVNDINFIHLMSIRKGRTLIGRLLHVLSQQHGQMLLIKVFSHVAHILKRDLQDVPSSLATASDSVTAAIRLSSSMQVVVYVISCLAASEDVVCDFTAHVVDACVSRASELLFEDSSNVDMWSTCCTHFCNQAGALIVSMPVNDSSRLLARVLISHPYVPIKWQTAFRQLSNAS